MAGPGDSLRLAELLCARISHDLSGMVGTVVGALELVDDPAVRAEAVPLAQQAANELRQRLELHRASWGPTGGPVSLANLRTLAEGLPHASRCRLDLDAVPADTVFAPAFARVLLNLLLFAADSLNGSGAVTVAGNAIDLVVALAGPRAAWPAGLAACLATDADAWAAVHDARSLQLPLTVLLARAAGLRLSLVAGTATAGLAPPLRLQEV